MLLVVPKYELWFSFPQPGILYVASTARSCGEKVELIDANIVSAQKFVKALLEKAQDHSTIALTVSIAHSASAFKISELVREKFP